MRSLLWFLLYVLSIPAYIAAQTPDNLNVVAVSPTRYSLSASTDTPIIVTFDRAVDPAAFNPKTLVVFGRWSGVMDGALTFEENDSQVRFTPDRPFSAGETITITLARTLMSATGQSLPKGYQWQFWTQPRRASLDLV